MWWCVVVFGCLQAAIIARSQPLTNEWIYEESQRQLQEQPQQQQQEQQRKIQARNAYQISNSSPTMLNSDELSKSGVYYEPSVKRALTLLSRWYPFSTLRRNVPSLREPNNLFVGADTDGQYDEADLLLQRDDVKRPKHQPLRWG